MKIVFMGTPVFSVPILEALINSEHEVCLVVTQPDKPVGRKKVLKPTPIKEVASKYDIPVFQPTKIREDYQPIIECNPDIIITAAYGQFIPKILLDFPKHKCINVHGSLLPKLRGGSPIHTAITEGYTETGVTLMYMAPKMDAGDMLFKRKIEITDTDTVGTLHDKMSLVGRDLLMESLPKIESGDFTPEVQNDEEVTFAPNIPRENEKINWNDTSVNIYNHIRGFNPWPTTYTMLESDRIKIFASEKTNDVVENMEPGTIYKIEKDGFYVVCGDCSGLKITEIQMPSKKKMKFSDYYNGTTNIDVMNVLK